jgi:D-arabinose 1-dehydrogenase-like Zn-dependent alcohol dehydrogenase
MKFSSLAKIIDFASKGIIKPLIGHALRLSDFRKAFELGESGKTGGKIVLTIPA